MQNTLQIGEYKELERYSHINLDDVLNKVTQEVWELIEAFSLWNEEEIYDEAWDVIVNILSVCEELWIDINWEIWYTKRDILLLFTLLWKWNSKIQWLRNRFSKAKVSIEEAQSVTSSLVREVLKFTNPKINMRDIIKNNTEKFSARKDLYKPDIDLRDYIWEYPDFPKPGINFKDISPLLCSPEALRYAVMEMAQKCVNSDVIVWLDARWFIFWSLVAQELQKPFVMLRKKWKLPWVTKEVSYWLEYGKDILEIQSWALKKWQKVSIIDDLLATWWTIKAAIDLVTWEEALVNNLMFVISLDEEWLLSLDSRKALWDYQIDSLLSYN